ncbi:hypothetical protein Tco_1094055 [Tanacetum coccineum]|uniref:Uncharacterized protein n=1 Tax=Tanacetum coccineum TaxID=301880 RepID=A0ABQ5IEG3_9ASTR
MQSYKRAGKSLEEPSDYLVPTPDVSKPQKEPEQNPETSSPVKTSDNFVKFVDELAPLDSLPPGNDDSTLKKDLHEENFQEDVEIKNSNIDDFLANEVSSNLVGKVITIKKGDIAFLDNLLSDDDSHNLDSKVTSDHEPEQNESSITFSPRSDPLHHEFAGEPLTLPARNDREFEEYLSLMTVFMKFQLPRKFS